MNYNSTQPQNNDPLLAKVDEPLTPGQIKLLNAHRSKTPNMPIFFAVKSNGHIIICQEFGSKINPKYIQRWDPMDVV